MRIVIAKEVIKKLKKSDNFVKNNFINVFNRLKDWFPFEKEWNVHKLKWKYWTYWSINLSWDYRVVFRVKDETIFIDKIGTHSELYW